MRLFAATFILSLFLGTAALAGGPPGDGPEQQMAQKTIIIQPDVDNTAAYVTAAGVIIAAGIGYLGVRRSRKG